MPSSELGKEPAANSTNPLQKAFARLFTLGTWAAHQSEEFTFKDAASALRSVRLAEYDGDPVNVDRMWSRDKRHLASAGVPLTLCSAGGYLRADPVRVRRTALESAALVARGRELPLTGDAQLESGLRKLWVLGAPILGALMERAARGGPAPRVASTPHAISVAMLLLGALDVAGLAGLTLDEAAVASGARDEEDLRRVVGLLRDLDLPFDPPDDALPLMVDEEHASLCLYRPTRVTVRPSLTPGARRPPGRSRPRVRGRARRGVR
ncbi:MAG: hypothetical protein QM704_00540 [Anaeromyxobacteraceae bacterium]